MLPYSLRKVANSVAQEKGAIKLAIFGPGKGSPYFQKRIEAFEAIQNAHPKVQIAFYLVDDKEPPATSARDYASRIYPAEIKQIEWADVILFLVTHHKLSALVELGLLHSAKTKAGGCPFEKCGLAIIDSLEVSSMWHYEARRLMNNNADKMISFSENDLQVCRVATDIVLELFERVVIDRWAAF